MLRTVARVAVAHWFFGNLYEEVVGIPAVIADRPPGGVLAPGSPARYFLPMAPITVGSVVALAAVDRSRPTVVAAVCRLSRACRPSFGDQHSGDRVDPTPSALLRAERVSSTRSCHWPPAQPSVSAPTRHPPAPQIIMCRAL